MNTTEATLTTATGDVAPAEPTADALSDESLDAIFAEPSEESTDDDIPADDTAEQQSEEPAKEGIDLDALKDETDATTEKPAEDAYVQMIRQYLPTPEALQNVVGAYQRETALSSAVHNNDVQGVIKSLGNNFEPLFEFFYQAGKEKLVERYIEEAQGQAVDPRVAGLERELSQLKAMINSGVQHQQQQNQTAAQRKALEAVHTAIDRDLTTAKFPDDEYHKVQRDLIRQSVLADLAQSGKLQDALRGNMKLVRAALRTRLEALVNADKGRAAATSAARAKLKTSQPITSGASGPTQTSASGESTKAGKRDFIQDAADWLDRAIKKGK